MKRDIISLGKNCFVAGSLKELGVIDRKQKNLFDDIGSPDVGMLANALSRRLDNFFGNLDDLDFYGVCQLGVRNYVYDRKMGILSSHHWKVGQDPKICYEKFIKDHDVKVFMKNLEISNNPLILRTNNSKTKLDEVVYLHNVIADIRKNYNFTLCVFQDSTWAEFDDWQSFLGLQNKSLMTFRTPVYTAPAETYPDIKPWTDWFLCKNDFSKWAKIFDYIFKEIGMDIRCKDPLGVKYF